MNQNYIKIYVDHVMLNETCKECARKNIINSMKFMYLNLNESIYKCSGADCMFPFRNFIFKDSASKLMYKYELEPIPSTILPSEPVLSENVSAEDKPSKLPEPSLPIQTTTKKELRKFLKSKEELTTPKISKFKDVNQLLSVLNRTAKKSSSDAGKINKISITNPLNLIRHLNRTPMKLAPIEVEEMI